MGRNLFGQRCICCSVIGCVPQLRDDTELGPRPVSGHSSAHRSQKRPIPETMVRLISRLQQKQLVLQRRTTAHNSISDTQT